MGQFLNRRKIQFYFLLKVDFNKVLNISLIAHGQGHAPFLSPNRLLYSGRENLWLYL